MPSDVVASLRPGVPPNPSMNGAMTPRCKNAGAFPAPASLWRFVRACQFLMIFFNSSILLVAVLACSVPG